jgi:hypothetical protein
MVRRPALSAHVDAVHDHLSPPAQVRDQLDYVLDLFDFGAGSTLVPFGSRVKLMEHIFLEPSAHTTERPPIQTPSRLIGSASDEAAS